MNIKARTIANNYPTLLSKDLIDAVWSLDQRATYQKYFPLRIDLRKNKYLNPFRSDKTAGSCHFNYLRNGKLYFFDKATGDKYDMIGFVSHMFNISYVDAAKRILADSGITDIKSPVPRKLVSDATEYRLPDVCYSFVRREWNDTDLEYWGKYGITVKDLELYNVLPCNKVNMSYNNYTWREWYTNDDQDPCYVYRNVNNEGKLHLKFYRPLTKNKALKWKSSVFLGFNSYGYHQLEPKGKYLFVVSSLKDGLCLRSLGYVNFVVLSSEQAVCLPEMEELTKRFEHIIYILDNDKTGITSMEHAKEIYPHIEYIIIPKDFNNNTLKDIAEICEQNQQNEIYRFLTNTLKSISDIES